MAGKLSARFCLETGRMALYMMLPVGLFYYFNQPKYFEEWVIKRKRELYPPEKLMNDQAIREFKEKLQQQKKEELRKQLVELDARKAS